MGSYDDAEIWVLVDLPKLSILRKVYGVQNIGLYKDDVLACLRVVDQHQTKYGEVSQGLSGRTLD